MTKMGQRAGGGGGRRKEEEEEEVKEESANERWTDEEKLIKWIIEQGNEKREDGKANDREPNLQEGESEVRRGRGGKEREKLVERETRRRKRGGGRKKKQ